MDQADLQQITTVMTNGTYQFRGRGNEWIPLMRGQVFNPACAGITEAANRLPCPLMAGDSIRRACVVFAPVSQSAASGASMATCPLLPN